MRSLLALVAPKGLPYDDPIDAGVLPSFTMQCDWPPSQRYRLRFSTFGLGYPFLL
ncbi:MAG: hypothetical protein AAGA48_13725 [Myxococcota bacterium]